nr:hypothetical protein [Tanacetum cinerariifolium]
MAPKKAASKRTTRMEMVFRISNCLVENQVKFATCTLLVGALTWWNSHVSIVGALTWWNSHVSIVGNDAAYVMTWIELKKKMADKSPTNANVANNQRGNGPGQKVTCYECGAQGHFKRYCSKLKNNNNNRGNQVGTRNAQARVYAVGNAGTNPDANTVTDHDYDVELADGRIVGVST